MASKRTDHELLVTTRMKDLVSKELRGLGKTGKATGAAIAGGFVAAKVALGGLKIAIRGTVNFVKGLTVELAEQGDVIAKTSKRLGVAVETLSAFKHIAELSGSSFDAVGKGFKQLAKNAVDFTNGIGEAAPAFAELGINVVDSAGNMRNLESIFLDTADALGKMEDTTKRAAHAQRIFGRAGTDLIPVFLEGKEGIIALRKEAERLGIVWTEESAASAEQFNDAMLRMERSIDGVKQAIGAELLPLLTDMFDDMTAFIVENREEIVEWSRSFIDDAIPAIRAFAADAKPLLRDVNSLLVIMARSARLVLLAFRKMGDISDLMGPQKALRVVQAFRPKRRDTSGMDPIAGLGAMSAGAAAGGGGGVPSSGGPSAADVDSMMGMISSAAAATDFTSMIENADKFNKAVIEMDTTMEDLAKGGISSVTGSFGTFFDTMLRGTADTAGAVRSMVTDILSSLARLALNQVFQQIGGALLGAALGGVTGGATSARAVTGYAPGASTLPSFATGGTIPGAIGSPQLVVAHGGEEVLSRADLRGGGGGGTVNVVVNPSPGMDERAVGEAAAAAVMRKMRESRGFRDTLRGYARGGLT